MHVDNFEEDLDDGAVQQDEEMRRPNIAPFVCAHGALSKPVEGFKLLRA